jgi:hypothetical protein
MTGGGTITVTAENRQIGKKVSCQLTSSSSR